MKKLLIGLTTLVVVAVIATAAVGGPSFFQTSIKYIFTSGATFQGGTVTFDGATIVGADFFDGEDITLANDEAISNGTNNVILFSTDEAGGPTLMGADDSGAAVTTLDTSGAGSIVIGSADVTSLTVTSDGTGNAEVVLPNASIGSAELGGATWRATFCGENAENGTTYYGPAGITVAEPVLGDTACDALDNTTEATADVVVSAGLVLTAKYMACRTDATLGASETLTFQLRDDTASVTGVTCQITEAQSSCDVAVPTATAIAAGSAIAVSAIEVSNNADDNGKCVVLFQVQ